MSSGDSILRWGIIGCGAISHDFTLALSRINSPKHLLVAAASKSSLESAEKFAKRFKMPRFYGSYEELLADPEINAVYIGNLHPDHMAPALAAINAGKAVLVEKPMTMNVSDTQRIVEASKAKGVLLMEALWSRFSPAYRRILQLIGGPNALKPVALQANFTVPIDHKPRSVRPELGGGAMLDIGVYCVQLATMVFGGVAPNHVLSTGQLSEDGVDLGESVSLQYASGGHANILVDIRYGDVGVCEARIFFRPGGEYISVRLCPPFWIPSKLELTKADGTVVVEDYPIYPNASTADGLSFNHVRSQGLAYEAEGFAEAFAKWKASKDAIEHPLRTHKDTLIDAHIIDTVLDQLKKQNVVQK